MNAHKISERLFGDDKIKCELIRFWLSNVEKIFDAIGGGEELIKSLSKGRLDENIILWLWSNIWKVKLTWRY